MKTLKNLSRSVALAVVASGSLALAAGPTLNCPAGTKQFGGAETMYDQGVFCIKAGTAQTAMQAHGPYVSFHKNGQKKAEGMMKDGGRTGLWVIYDEAGNKESEIEFAGDSFHGRKLQYHPNGQKKLEETWVAGKREGTAREFDAAGKLVSAREYKADRPVAVTR